jgi:xanthine/CO dehydrogenase XdhC/CoxF family maturation factor
MAVVREGKLVLGWCATADLIAPTLAVEQTRNISPRYALRLDDLRPWHVIVATCAVCRRRAHVVVALLHHGRPPYTRVLDLERKLCCTNCGNRHGNTLNVSMAPRN